MNHVFLLFFLVFFFFFWFFFLKKNSYLFQKQCVRRQRTNVVRFGVQSAFKVAFGAHQVVLRHQVERKVAKGQRARIFVDQAQKLARGKARHASFGRLRVQAHRRQLARVVVVAIVRVRVRARVVARVRVRVAARIGARVARIRVRIALGTTNLI